MIDRDPHDLHASRRPRAARPVRPSPWRGWPACPAIASQAAHDAAVAEIDARIARRRAQVLEEWDADEEDALDALCEAVLRYEVGVARGRAG